MDVEITRKTDGKLVAYACPECGIIYSILRDDAAARDAALKSAQTCCPPRKCVQCNARPVERGSTVCEVCAAHNAVAAETQRFAASSRVSEAQWPGPVYWPAAPFAGDHGGFYWSSTSRLRSDIAERNSQRASSGQPLVQVPAYVYATKPIKFRVDGRAAIEAALAEHSDSVEIGSDQVVVLQKFLDEWSDKQAVQSYEEDLTKAVVLG